MLFNFERQLQGPIKAHPALVHASLAARQAVGPSVSQHLGGFLSWHLGLVKQDAVEQEGQHPACRHTAALGHWSRYILQTRVKSSALGRVVSVDGTTKPAFAEVSVAVPGLAKPPLE